MMTVEQKPLTNPETLEQEPALPTIEAATVWLASAANELH